MPISSTVQVLKISSFSPGTKRQYWLLVRLLSIPTPFSVTSRLYVKYGCVAVCRHVAPVPIFHGHTVGYGRVGEEKACRKSLCVNVRIAVIDGVVHLRRPPSANRHAPKVAL